MSTEKINDYCWSFSSDRRHSYRRCLATSIRKQPQMSIEMRKTILSFDKEYLLDDFSKYSIPEIQDDETCTDVRRCTDGFKESSRKHNTALPDIYQNLPPPRLKINSFMKDCKQSTPNDVISSFKAMKISHKSKNSNVDDTGGGSSSGTNELLQQRIKLKKHSSPFESTERKWRTEKKAESANVLYPEYIPISTKIKPRRVGTSVKRKRHTSSCLHTA